MAPPDNMLDDLSDKNMRDPSFLKFGAFPSPSLIYIFFWAGS
jgi:hypothetical protein